MSLSSHFAHLPMHPVTMSHPLLSSIRKKIILWWVQWLAVLQQENPHNPSHCQHQFPLNRNNQTKGKANTWKNSTDSTAMLCNNNCHLQSPTVHENVWYRVCSSTPQRIMEGCMHWMEIPPNAKGHIDN
jgi:hypothetical protein